MPRRRSVSRSPSGSRSGASRSRSPLGSRSRSRSPRSPSRTPSRSPSRSRSRSQSPAVSLGGHPKDGNLWDGVEVAYEDFVPADEETPTFHLAPATVELIRNRVYQAAPLNKKYFNEIKKEKYMMTRDIHDTLEPKPVPSQVVSSLGGVDLNKLHGSLLHLHKVSRLSQRPIWALTEQLQKTRKLLKDTPSPQFFSPPYIGTGAPPEGFVEMEYNEDEAKRFSSQAPKNPSETDFNATYKRLGVHVKFHESATRAMTEMTGVIKQQQQMLVNVADSFNEMWSRTQDYLNMSRYLESHVKEMRRSQLVKQHTKEFTDWLDNHYLKDKDKLGARDKSDEILAADYDAVIKQFNEDRKNKNVALKKRSYAPRYNSGGRGGGKASSVRDSARDTGAGPSRGGGGSHYKYNNNNKQRKEQKKSDDNKAGSNGDSRGSGGRAHGSDDSKKKQNKKGRTA